MTTNITIWARINSSTGTFLDFEEILAQDRFDELDKERLRYDPNEDEYILDDLDEDIDDWLDDYENDEPEATMIPVEVPVSSLIKHMLAHERYRNIVLREVHKLMVERR